MTAPSTMTIDQALALAIEHHQAGRLAQAEEIYGAILAAQPGHLNALFLSAQSKRQAGNPEEAAALLERALAAHPRVARLHATLGEIRFAQGRPADAAAALRAALAIDPTAREVWLLLAQALQRAGDGAAAERAWRLPGILAPDDAEGLAHRGMHAAAARRFDEAILCFERALALNPAFIEAALQLSDIARALCRFDDIDRAAARLIAMLRARPAAFPWRHLTSVLYRDLFMPLPPDLVGALGREVDRQLVAETAAAGGPLPARALSAYGRPHVAFLSANFGDHPIGHVTRSLFGHLDRARMTVSGFALRDHRGEAAPYARDIAAGFDRFHSLTGRSPADAARAIREAGVDVLVFIDGYMEKAGMEILARRPAPVQAFWLGHAGGLGLSTVDYLIADAAVVPPGEEPLYREAVVRLPEIYHCADRHAVADATPARAAAGLPEDGVVFCGFNSPEKIDRRIFDAWMRILRAVPGSVLWLSHPGGFADRAGALQRAAAARGVDPARLLFAGRVADKAAHLARHRCCDLFLDTLTLNASTTALDALWAGLPVLTVRGDRFPGRIATTMNMAAGLGDLVCPDLDAYEARAVALAGDPAAIAALKGRLDAARLSAPLFDTPRFARHLGEALVSMWRRAAAGEPPRGFDVSTTCGAAP